MIQTLISILIFACGLVCMIFTSGRAVVGLNRWRMAGHNRGFAAVMGWTGIALSSWLAWNVLLAVCILVNRG